MQNAIFSPHSLSLSLACYPFPLKFSISSQPGWQAGTIKVTLLQIYHSFSFSALLFFNWLNNFHLQMSWSLKSSQSCGLFIRLRSILIFVTIFQCCYHCCVRRMKMLLKVDKDRGNDPVCGTMHKKRTPCHHKHLSSPYLCNIYVKSIFTAVFLCLLFLLQLWGSTTRKINNPFMHLKSIRQNWKVGDMHTCKKRVMLRWGYFGQKKFAEKVRKSRQNVNRDKSA